MPEARLAVPTEPAVPDAGLGSSVDALWQQVRRQPRYAPELLALALVDRYGPVARDYVAWLRATYPDVPDDGLARHVVRRFERARYVGPAGGLGAASVLADMARLLSAKAQLALHLAAVYRLDPTDADRAAELLVLTRAHPDIPRARTALAALATAPRYPRDGSPADGPAAAPDGGDRAAEGAAAVGPTAAGVPLRGLGRVLALPLGGRLAIRAARHAVPGLAPALTMMLNAQGIREFSVRALAWYQPIRAGVPRDGAHAAPAGAQVPAHAGDPAHTGDPSGDFAGAGGRDEREVT